MNAQEKRIRLAELRGWRRKYDGTLVLNWIKPDGTQIPEATNRYMEAEQLPDYCGDLNEIHKVEKELTPEQHCAFRYSLRKITSEKSDNCDRDYLSATAEQRTDALIIALS